MAVDSSCEVEREPQNREFLDANASAPVSCSRLKLLEPRPEDVDQRFPLETPPVLFEENSHPAGLYQTLHSANGPDVYSISVLPEEDDNKHCASPLAFLSILEIPKQSKSPTCIDAYLNCHNYIDFQMKREDAYSTCIIDIPRENENSNSPESYEEGSESSKAGNLPTGVLQRQASMRIGERLMQLLMNLGTSRVKLVTEKLHDIPSNRWRKYKRAASFDSRKVALVFSLLSSLGTLVLIYLTLRVKQRGDGFVLI